MTRASSILLALIVVPVLASAEPVLDEDTVRAIAQKLNQSFIDGDISILKKYMYPGSKIIVDTDPTVNRGQIEVDYDSFMQLTEMAVQNMQEASVHDEVLSVSVDAAANEATIREKTTATVSMLGSKVRDVSISTTTYGVVGGEIKVLVVEDELISSEIVE